MDHTWDRAVDVQSDFVDLVAVEVKLFQVRRQVLNLRNAVKRKVEDFKLFKPLESRINDAYSFRFDTQVKEVIDYVLLNAKIRDHA